MAKPIETDSTASTPSAPAHRRDLGRVEPLNTAELINTGVRTELLVAMALHRAAGGGVTKSGDHYFERGYPYPAGSPGCSSNSPAPDSSPSPTTTPQDYTGSASPRRAAA